MRNSDRIGAVVAFLAIAICAIGPIRSYDFFWHLATGRWILEHRALPLYDPFAVASAHVPWINGEWLWEVAIRIAHLGGGITGVLIGHAIAVGLIFALAARGATSWLAIAVAFAGAWDRLGVRPSTSAALLLVIALLLLDSRLDVRRLAIAYAVLTALWINIHPSALLAPLIAAIAMLADWRRWMVAATSAVALFANPFGWRAIAAPFALSAAATSGEYVNAEWLPSLPLIFPLLYLTIAVFVVLFVISKERRAHLWRFIVFALLAILAMRYVRNQGLYFAALPLLATPLIANRFKRTSAIVALAIVALTFTRGSHRLGVDDTYFPVRAAARLRVLNLPGNIYNADQFGGYLEWTFYPARRALTDGRNELFRDFIHRDAQAHADSRAWRALLRDCHVDLAVDEYAPPMTVYDMATHTQHVMPASLARYPPREWALVAYDGVAMVFARKAAFGRMTELPRGER